MAGKSIQVKKLDRLIKEAKELYGKDIFEVSSEVYSWGLPMVDSVLGGLPSHIVELYGAEGGGKTTIGLLAIKSAQERGFPGVFIDAENSFNEAYAKALGVDTDKLIVIRKNLMEDVLDLTIKFLSLKESGIVVIDSLPSLVPKAVFEDFVEKEDLNKKHVANRARLMSEVLGVLVGLCKDSKNTLIIINQIRDKVGILFGNPTTTPGGKALKHFAIQRVEVRPGRQIKKGADVIGREVYVRAVKNKIAAPERKTQLSLIFGKGFKDE